MDFGTKDTSGYLLTRLKTMGKLAMLMLKGWINIQKKEVPLME